MLLAFNYINDQLSISPHSSIFIKFFLKLNRKYSSKADTAQIFFSSLFFPNKRVAFHIENTVDTFSSFFAFSYNKRMCSFKKIFIKIFIKKAISKYFDKINFAFQKELTKFMLVRCFVYLIVKQLIQ